MDAQLRRGLPEACVLSALNRHASYGHQIIRELEHCAEISESTRYPILRGLEAAECPEACSVEHSGQARLEGYVQDWARIRGIYQFIIGGEA